MKRLYPFLTVASVVAYVSLFGGGLFLVLMDATGTAPTPLLDTSAVLFGLAALGGLLWTIKAQVDRRP